MKPFVAYARKVIVWSVCFLVGLALLTILLLQFSYVQSKLVGYAASYLSTQTGTQVSVGRLSIGFPRSIVIQNIFANDLNRDTLLYAEELSVGINMFSLFDNKIEVSELSLTGVNTHISRSAVDSHFNFSFFIKLFQKNSEIPALKDRAIDSTIESQPFLFDIEDVSLQNIRGSYVDDVFGLSIKGQIGNLLIHPKTINLQRFDFFVQQLSLSETTVWLDISKLKSAPTTDTTTTVMPGVCADRLTLHNVKFYLNKPNDSLYFFSEVGDLDMIPSTIDLNKQLIAVTSLNIQGSNTGFTRIPSTSVVNDTAASTQFWNINLAHGNLSNNTFTYDVAGIPKQKQGIDYNHLHISSININASNLHYGTDNISGTIKKLQANEQCGLELKQLSTRFVYDDHHAELANLNLQTSHSVLNRYLRASWSSLDRIAQHPEELDIHLQFNNSKVSMEDILLVAPQLASYTEFKNKKAVNLNGSIKGRLQALQLKTFSAQTGQLFVEATGQLNNVLTPKELSFKFPKIIASGTRMDLESIVPKQVIPASISIPERFLVTGAMEGSTQTASGDLHIQCTDGEIFAKGSVDINQQQYSIHTQAKAFNAGKIIGIQQWLGPVTGSIDIEGQYFDLKRLRSTVHCQLEQAELYKYSYTNLTLEAKADSGAYNINMQVNDTALTMFLLASGNLSSEKISSNLNAKVTHANLFLMNISNEKYSGKGELNCTIHPSSLNRLSASLDIKHIQIKKNNRTYNCDSLLNLQVNETRNNTNDKSVITAQYIGSTRIDRLENLWLKYLNQYTNPKATPHDSLTESLSATMNIRPHPLLTEVFFPNLQQFNGAKLELAYNDIQNTLLVDASMPLLEMDNMIVKEFSIEAKGSTDTFYCKTSVLSFQRESIAFPKTKLQIFAAQNALGYELHMLHPDSGSRIWIKGSANRLPNDHISISLAHPYIILNNQEWVVEENNRILIMPDGVTLENMSLTNRESQVSVTSETKLAPVTILFKNFEIGTFSQLIEKDSAIARGMMNGTVILQTHPTFGFTSDLNVSQLAINRVEVGDLNITAQNSGNNQYVAHAILKGSNNDVDANLLYQSNKLNLDVDINRFNLTSIEAFIPQTIRRSSGFVYGHIKLSNQSSHLTYNGQLAFSNASFNLALINSRLYMEDEDIQFDQKGLYFNNFTIRDSMQQPMVVNGNILTPQSNPITYNLNIKTEQFRILNTTAKDNPIYYGTLLLNSNIHIEGTEKLPVITAQARLIEGSHMTFVVQQGELSTDKGDGVVVFTDSLNKTLVSDSSLVISSLRGLDLRVNIEVNNKTQLNVITDKMSGDNLQVSGNALMSFTMDPKGRMSLLGSYELSEGKYKASFQKIVKRDFVIKKGSTIIWSGDPLDAQIDITATYKAKTGATDLLAAELSGVPQSERNAYRKLLNYDVNLMMHGFLLKPQLNFKLDMAPKDQQAFNGMVYAKINQINSDVNELNKQVFSILIMGRFLPVGMSSNTSTTDAVSAVARNSVNQMLSDQMNTISGKYVKGAELNFNLQSNDDYTAQGTQQNTELQIGLKKEMFNNRVSVQVGSNIDVDGNNTQTNGQNITGDLVMEYKITEDGRYKFKAFRENNYEGVIDGLIYRTGVGLNFTRNFDSIQQLFRDPKPIEQPKTDSTQSE